MTEPTKPRLKIPFTLVSAIDGGFGGVMTFNCPELECWFTIETPNNGAQVKKFGMHTPESSSGQIFPTLADLLTALKQKYGEDEFNLRLKNANAKRDEEMKAD